MGNAERILKLIAASLPVPAVNMFHAAGQFLLSFGARPARELARAGYTKADVKKWVWENARFQVGWLRRSGILAEEQHMRYWGHGEEGAPDVANAKRRDPAAYGAQRRHDPCRGDRWRFAMVDGLLARMGQLWRLRGHQGDQTASLGAAC